jgi:hypothetical protein
MRTSLLISSTGTVLNPTQTLINSSPLDLSAGSSLFINQITVCFYTGIITEANGLIVPNRTTKVTSGLTGTITVTVWPAEDAPYPVTITPGNTIDISSSCILQWNGITELLDIATTSIVGASYINVLLDRN